MDLHYYEKKNPIKRVHYVGTSAVLTIDQYHVKRLGIDELTFFEEKEVDNGILLELRKLGVPQREERKVLPSPDENSLPTNTEISTI
jgi:hypothetical protein